MPERLPAGVLTRRVTDNIFALHPGEWTPMGTVGQEGHTHVALCCPWCGNIATSSHHQHTFHEDGTFTATPSFVCPHDGCGWHVFITRSAWS